MDAAEGGGDGAAGENNETRCPTVLFREDDPEKGVVTLILMIPRMAVKRSAFRKLQPSNGFVKVTFHTGSVEVRAKLNDEQSSYVYERSLPDDILALLSKYKVKNEAIVLSLAKTNAEKSWAQHSKYFTQKVCSVSSAAAAAAASE